MKRIFNLIAFAFIATISANASSLYLRFANPASYNVNIDGFYYQVNGTDFSLPFIGAGRHSVIISSCADYNRGYRRPIPEVFFNGSLMIGDCMDMFASLEGCRFRVEREVPHYLHNNYRRPYYYVYNNRFRRYDLRDGDDFYRNGSGDRHDNHYDNDRNRRDNDHRGDKHDDHGRNDREEHHGNNNEHRGHR